MTDQTESEYAEWHSGEFLTNPEAVRAYVQETAAAIRALEAKVREVEDECTGYVATLGKALRDLSFAAQTTGGTAGRDDGLVAAIDAATAALSMSGVVRGMVLVDELRAEVARLTSELAAAREDAERIDFASGPRIQVVQNDFIGGEWRVYRLHGPINDTHRTLISEGPTWREAVDAARSAGGGA